MLGAILAAAPGFARQITFDEALGNLSGRSGTRAAHDTPKLLYTQSYAGLNVAYVVQEKNNEGYLVLAADDLLPSVLGYSDSGSIDPASMPPAMEYWLEEYGRQLAYVSENISYASEMNGTAGSSAMAYKARRKASHEAIAPLCDAVWGQSAPFNNNCPEYDRKHSPAGCTATAMAQVMNAHKWPLTGTGKNSYISGTLRQNLSFNFGETTFDWNNILPSYAAGYTPEEGAAVATLLEACGNAALMDYGQNASGAYPYNAIYGMVNFMKYDRSALLLLRDYYSAARWDEMIYEELANGRPVLYGGYTPDYRSGHTFVVDGYSSDGYFHINWGWSGLSNGYFLLSALDPADQGIGGSSSGYNYKQDAVIKIMPAKDDSKYQLEVMLEGEFSTTAKNYSNKASIEFTAGDKGYYTAFTIAEAATAEMGIRLTPAEGGETVFYPGSTLEFKAYYGESEQTYTSFTIPVNTLPSTGEYIAVPAYRYENDVKDVAVKTGMQNSLKMSFAKMGVAIQDISVSRELTADNISVLTPLYTGKTCNVTADIHNSGEEYHAIVKAGFANTEGTVLAWLDNVPVSIPDGETINVSFTGTLVRMTDGKPLETGDYFLSIYDEEGKQISAPVDVVINEAPAGKPVYDMKIAVKGALSGDGTGVDPYIVGDQVTAEITVSVSTGLFEDVVGLYAYYENGDEANFSGENSNTKSFFVGPGKTQTNNYIIGTANFTVGKTVYVSMYGWDSTMSGASSGWFPQKIYMKRTQSGVEGIAAADISKIEVYSVSGTKVKTIEGNGSDRSETYLSELPGGIYIIVVHTLNGIETRRFLKR